MKHFFLIPLFAPLWLAAQQTPCREVIGHYAGWQWYDRNKLMNPESVPYGKYTILTYAFFEPQSDGSLRISDPWGDKNQLLGPIDWAKAPAGYDTGYDFGNPDFHIPGKTLSDYAHQGGCKLLVSVGGWTYSAHFPTIATDPQKRTVFAHDCNTIVRLYGLDGIDIDWEYPANPNQKAQFTLLLQQVRDSLDALEPLLGRELMLTMAAGASPAHMAQVDWDAVKQIVDIVNLMTYDFYGTWDQTTNHNTPLYPVAFNGQPGFSCSEAVEGLLAAGVPAQQITMGLAWYGRSQMTIGPPDAYVAGTGQPDLTHFGADEGTPLYYNIQAALDDFHTRWDSVAQVPYLTGKTSNSFLSYDNEASITLKALFIHDMDLRGAVIWEISGDYIENPLSPGTIAGTPLTDALNETLCEPGTGIQDAEEHPAPLSIHPNPVQDRLFISMARKTAAFLTYAVHDLNGRTLLSGQLDGQGHASVDVSTLADGLYFLQIGSGANRLFGKIVVE